MTRTKFIFLLLCILISVGAITFFYGGCNKSEIKKEHKAFELKDKVQVEKVNGIKRSIDSSIKKQEITKDRIVKSKTKISSIKKSRNEERNIISAIPDNEQALLMSKWISEIDTLR